MTYDILYHIWINVPQAKHFAHQTILPISTVRFFRRGLATTSCLCLSRTKLVADRWLRSTFDLPVQAAYANGWKK